MLDATHYRTLKDNDLAKEPEKFVYVGRQQLRYEYPSGRPMPQAVYEGLAYAYRIVDRYKDERQDYRYFE